MTDLASLYIRVDSTGVVTASRDLDTLAGKSRVAEKATDSVTNSFKSQIGIVKELAAAYGLYKLAQYAAEATMAAARYETLGVVMRVVGNNAGYTGAQMEAFAKSLQKTGISMTESRQSLTRMVQAHLDLNQAAKLARVAQDAAVIGNINSSEAFQRLVYGIQSAQVEVLRTIGINVNFENSYKKVAEATGRTVASFSEVEKAQIRMNAAIEAGIQSSEAYEASMNTAGKQALSLKRHFDDLKVILGGLFTPALTEIIETITGGIKDLNGELSGSGKAAIKEWGTNFRIVIISIEAEIMRLAMLLDKIGGTLTSAQMLLYGPGRALGVESSTKRFEAAADANMMFEERYRKTDKALEALAAKQIALEHSLTEAGKKSAAAAEDAAERKRIAAGEVAKAARESADKEAKALEEARLAAEKAAKEAERIAKQKEAAIVDYIENLEKEIKMIGLDEAAKERLEAREKGLTGARLASVDAMISQKKAQEALWRSAEDANNAIGGNIEDGIRMAQDGDRERRKNFLAEQKKVEEDWKKSLEKQEKELEKYHERIQEATADAFYDMFKNIDEGFSSLFNRIGDYFLKLLAEMAAQAITKPIIVPIIQSFQSGLGMGTAGSGGSSGLGTLFNAASTGKDIWSMFGGGASSTAAMTSGFTSASLLGDTSFSGASLFGNGAAGGSGWGTSSFLNAGLYGETTDLAYGLGTATTSANSFSSALSAAAPYLMAYTAGSMLYGPVADATGLPQGKYSGMGAGAGAAGGLYAVSQAGWAAGPYGWVVSGIAAILGAVLGGAGASFLGGDGNRHMRVQGSPTLGYGGEMDFGPRYYDYENQHKPGFLGDPALGGRNTYYGEAFGAVKETTNAAAKVVWESIDSMLSELPESVAYDIKRDLEALTITFADSKWVVASDNFETHMEMILKDFVDTVTDAITPVIEAGLSEYAQSLITSGTQSELFGRLSDKNLLKTSLTKSGLFNSDFSKKSGVEFETYMAGVQEWLTTMGQIEQVFASVDEAVSEILNPLTDTEKGIKNLNRQFDGFLSALYAIGASTEELTALEENRATALANFNIEMAKVDTGKLQKIADSFQRYQLGLMGFSDDAITMQQFSKKYNWGTKYGSDGDWDWEKIYADGIKPFMTMAFEDFEALAGHMGMSWEDLARDTTTLNDIFNSLGETAKESIGIFGDLADSIRKQILDLKTGLTNPADVLTRIGIMDQGISDFTKGMSVPDFLASLGSESEKANAISSLQGMYGQRNTLYGEAWQRPSLEYQGAFGGTIAGLEALADYADILKSEYQLQYEQTEHLRTIAANTASLARIPEYADGGWTGGGGLALTHPNELVLNPEQQRAVFSMPITAQNDSGSVINITVHAHGGNSDEVADKAVAKMLQVLPAELGKGTLRVAVQHVADRK